MALRRCPRRRGSRRLGAGTGRLGAVALRTAPPPALHAVAEPIDAALAEQGARRLRGDQPPRRPTSGGGQRRHPGGPALGSAPRARDDGRTDRRRGRVDRGGRRRPRGARGARAGQCRGRPPIHPVPRPAVGTRAPVARGARVAVGAAVPRRRRGRNGRLDRTRRAQRAPRRRARGRQVGGSQPLHRRRGARPRGAPHPHGRQAGGARPLGRLAPNTSSAPTWATPSRCSKTSAPRWTGATRCSSHRACARSSGDRTSASTSSPSTSSPSTCAAAPRTSGPSSPRRSGT